MSTKLMEGTRLDIPRPVLEKIEDIVERRTANWLKMIVRAPSDANELYLEVGKLQAADLILKDIKSSFRPL